MLHSIHYYVFVYYVNNYQNHYQLLLISCLVVLFVKLLSNMVLVDYWKGNAILIVKFLINGPPINKTIRFSL